MTLRPRLALPALLVAVAIASPGSTLAQEKDKDKAAKAKAAVVENLKKCKIDKPTIVETENFIVAGSLSEERAKALGAVLEKMLPLARKAAKFDEKDLAWKGKLAVYFLPEGEEFKSFMRRVLQTPPEGAHIDLRSDLPLVVDPAELPGKPTDADLFAATAARIAGEHLRAKGTGTQVIPEWLRDGFGRVTVMRAEGTTSKRYQAYRTAARNALFNSKAAKPPGIADVGTGEKSAASEALANSLAEFLAYGPKQADFGKFLDGLRPTEAVANPTVQQGFEALGWKEQAMAETAWKRWVQTGK